MSESKEELERARHALFLNLTMVEAIKADIKRQTDLAPAILANTAQIMIGFILENGIDLIKSVKHYVRWQHGLEKHAPTLVPPEGTPLAEQFPKKAYPWTWKPS